MKTVWPPARHAHWLIVAITFVAFFLRVWQLDAVPPGWSDDELSDVLVLTQKVVQGDYSVYYVDATGQEALYFVISSLFLKLLGYNAFGIRLLSAALGTMAVPLTYQVGRRFFSRQIGLLAAGLMAASFWALIYSRIGLRQVMLPVFVLSTVYFFWTGLQTGRRRHFLAAGLWLGVGFYTYFASRGVPLILIAASAYVWLADRQRWRQTWRGQALTLIVALTIAVPLVATLLSVEGADARVAEVAVPIVAARSGDFEPLRTHVVRTLSMFHADGDDEFLYNIPGRPVFGPVGAVAFWIGVLAALWSALRPLRCTTRARSADLAAGFLLLWWLAGISPGFLSVPPASLGHTIVAQPATYLIAALPLRVLSVLPGRQWLLPALAVTLLATGLSRDLPDYFVTWPERGNTRFLYHADIRDVAKFVQENPELRDFAISGLLAGPWAREALRIDLENTGNNQAQPRWYDPRRAVIVALRGQPAVAFAGYPRVETVYDESYRSRPARVSGGYELFDLSDPAPSPAAAPVHFRNGLSLTASSYDVASGVLHLTWEVVRPLELPPQPLVSKPPPPGVNDQPRLAVFTHLLDDDGDILVGDDGLWVDAQTLQPGDVFRQQHYLPAPIDATPAALAVGLYDPHSGERLLTEAGTDSVALPFP